MAKKKIQLEKCKHPNSRKTIALTKQIKKASNKDKAKLGQAMKLNVIGEKVLWFKQHIDDSRTQYAAEEIESLIELYLARFDEELSQIKTKHSIGMRKNRQHANREDIINMTIKGERDQFNTCGIEMPDLINPQQVKLLREWNEELRFLQNFKLRRFSKKFLTQEIVKSGKPTTDKEAISPTSVKNVQMELEETT